MMFRILATILFAAWVSLLASLAGDSRFGRWVLATLGAWVALGLIAYSADGPLEPLWILGGMGMLACVVGTAIAMAVGRR